VKREPPTPPKPSVSPNEGNDAPTQTAHRRRPGLQLLSGASAQENAGFLSGQLYADALVESAAAASKPTIDETIKAIREELDAAEDYEDLRKRLRARYEEMSPEELNSIVFAAMALADLAGRAAVQEDV
jgi:phage gp29-like protein